MEAIVIAVITGVAVILGGGGVGLWWLKRRDPIEQDKAQLALALDSVGIMATTRDALASEVERLREDQDEDRARIDRLEQSVGGLQARLDRWTSWYRDLVIRWDTHRIQPHAPAGPDTDT